MRSEGLGKQKVMWEWVLVEGMEGVKVLLQRVQKRGWDCNPDLGVGLCACLGNLGAAASPASSIAFYCYYRRCGL